MTLSPPRPSTLPDAAQEALVQESSVSSERPDASRSPRISGEMKIFASTFFTIFFAELGDKTQVTTLLMSAESQSPWIVFLGAGAALVTTSLLGVLVGRWLASRVSEATLKTSVGGLLIGIAVLLLWDVVSAA